jgi:uncharacterized membrane protein
MSRRSLRPTVRTPLSSSLRQQRSRKVERRKNRRLLVVERFEDRLMMAVDFPVEIIAGRTLSAYSSSDVQNGQMKLTYAVYNQRELPMDDVQVSVKLATGVGFVQASLPPGYSGQDLVWDLGTLPAYGRRSFEVTVSLASASVLQIDEGVRVQGRIDAGLASDTAPAATLRNSPIPLAELSSTIDANANDPVIMEKAAALDYDPAKIFAFLNEEVGYEAYEGSLRGSRGALWSAAGNSLDEASLGVALFRASGIPARYASGTLSSADTEFLILSMFPEETHLVGYLPTGTVGADPARDPELIAIARNHCWLQVDLGSGFQNADTSGFPGSGIGFAPAAVASTFNEVADALRHKVTVTLDAEVYSETQAAFNAGNGVSITRVLDRTWNAVELVGKPVTVAHFVVDKNQGGLAFSSRTISYTPYFRVGDAADFNDTNDQIFTGIAYQENLTNFPLGSQFLIGLSLNMNLTASDGTIEYHQRALVDRIGYGNRKNGISSSIPVDATAPSIIGPFDAMTINASAATLPARYAEQLAEKIRKVQAYFNSLDLNLPLSNEDQSKFRSQLVDLTRLMTYRYFHQSDELVNRAAEVGAVRSYFDKPRLILGSAIIAEATPSSKGSLKLSLDLRRDSARVILFPGQSRQAEFEFRAYQGFAATGLERSIVASMLSGKSEADILNSQSVFEAAEKQNIPIVALFPEFLPSLSNRINGSADALARISDALLANKIVLVPEAPVLIDGKLVTAWYETDMMTGGTIGVAEDGGHLSATEWAFFTVLNSIAAYEFSFIAGLFTGMLAGTFGKLEAAVALAGVGSIGSPILASLTALAGAINPPLGVYAASVSASAVGGFGFGYSLGVYLTNKDPSAEGQLYQALPPQRKNRDKRVKTHSVSNGTSLAIVPFNTSIFTNQNQYITVPYSIVSNLVGDYEVSVTAPQGWDVTLLPDAVSIQTKPGTQSGVGKVRLVARSIADSSLVAQSTIDVTVQPTSPGLVLAIEPDPIFFVPFQEAELPTAFQAQIQNLGPADEAYQLIVSNVTPGWDVITSADTAFVNAGTSGTVGVYLRPKGNVLPPAGTTVSFTVTATSNGNSSIVKTVTTNFTLPSVSAVSMTVKPFMVESFPGSITNGSITIQNVGHVQEELRLGVNGLTTGFVLDGVPQTLSLAPGQKVDIPVTLTIASSTAINATAYVHVTLSNNLAGAAVRKAGLFHVRVVVPGAEALSNASVTAYQLGQTDLGNRLSDLSISLSNLVQTPTDSVAKSQSVAAIDAVVKIISADPTLSSLYTSDLKFAGNQLEAANTLEEIQLALDYLASILTSLSTTLTELVERKYTLSLVSNVITALPGVPAQFQVVMENKGTKATTFDLSVGGLLPFGTTASFNRTSVTLQPGETLQPGPNGITLSLSFTEDFLIPASFTVDATPQEAPTLVQRASASVALRQEFLQFISVDPNPSFTQPSGIVDISARLLSVVNSSKKIFVSYQVKDSGGNVIFTSAATPVNLSIRDTIAEVALPTLDTSSFQRTEHSIVVTATDENGLPLPGLLGQASLQIGTPVSASITVSPEKVFAGRSVVSNTLLVDSRTSPPNPLSLVGQVQTIPTSTTIMVRGELAYVGGTNGLNIVNISDPRNPVVVGAFGQADIVQGGFVVVRELSGNRVLVGTQASINASELKLLTYSLADPLNPSLIAQSTVPRQFLSDLFVIGDHAIATTTGIDFFAGNVLNQFGDVSSLNLSNPAAVSISDELYGPFQNIFNHNGGEIVDANTLYVTSTTSNGGFSNTQLGYGVVRVVDTSNPTDLIELRDVRIPETVQALEIAIDGNRALVVGSTGGWKSPFNGAQDAQLTGRMTLTLLDITDRKVPVVIGSTLITESLNRPIDTVDGGAKLSVISLGNGRFAVSRGYVQGAPALVVVDTAGDEIVYASILVPSMVNEMALVNGKLYTTSQTGLQIYDIGTIESIPTTISTVVPHSDEFDNLNRVLLDSFNIPPDQIIDGTGTKTLIWKRPFAFGNSSSLLTWNTELSGVDPNEFRSITKGTEIDFVFQGTSGSLALPSTSVVGQTLIEVLPARQQVAPGATASYDVVLSNPTNDFLTFTLSVSGIPSSWIDLPTYVFVNPNSTHTEQLRVTAPAKSPEGSMDFRIVATAGGSLQGVRQATLELMGTPVFPDPHAHGVVVSILPMSSKIGQGGEAVYTIRLTNTGSVSEEFALSSILPSGFTGIFEKSTVTLLPGRDNFQDVRLKVTSAIGNPVGLYTFSVKGESASSGVSSTLQGEIEVLNLGVAVTLDRTSGSPGDTFQAVVTNVGNTAEIFDLVVAGPAGLLASLAISQVNLQPGQTQSVAVSTLPFNSSLPGGMDLTVAAKSHTVPSVVGTDTVVLNIPQTKGLSSRFEPSSKSLVGPGTVAFQMLVSNLGNTEDAYTATILDVQGSVIASLVGTDGNATQTIPVFRLPAFGQGAIQLNASMQTVGVASVIVQIRSLSDGTIISESIATLEVTAAPPEAIPDTYLLQQGEDVNLVVLANDQPKGFAIDLSSLEFRDGPQHATISANSVGQVAWDPNPDYFGTDSFSYRYANDQGVYSNWTTVSLEINGRPIARDNSEYVRRNVETLVNVLSNDTDPDGVIANATIEILTSIDAGQGQLDVVDRKVRFRPTTTFDSLVSFQYRVVDSKGGTSTPATVVLGVYNQNPFDPYDVNQDGFVNAIDALVAINSLNAKGARNIPPGNNTAPFYDVDGDGFLSAIDPLVIINFLNRRSEGEGEGFEGEGTDVSIAEMTLGNQETIDAAITDLFEPLGNRKGRGSYRASVRYKSVL